MDEFQRVWSPHQNKDKNYYIHANAYVLRYSPQPVGLNPLEFYLWDTREP